MNGDQPPTADEPRRPFLLRRAWLAWTVATLVAVAGGLAVGWLFRERTAAADDLAQVRQDLATVSARADDLTAQSEPLAAANDERQDVLDGCGEGLGDRIDAYNKLSEEYGELDFLPVGEEATGLRDRFIRISKQTDRALRTCRAAAGGA